MDDTKISTNPILTIIRWTARLTSILFTGVLLLMFLGEGFDPARVTPHEWISLFFFPFGFVVGMIVAWWREGLGGAIAVISLFAVLFVGDFSSAGGGFMLICGSPGFLFLLYWFLSRMGPTPEWIPADEKGSPGFLAPLPDAEELEVRTTRLAKGLCPKCEHRLSASDKNCPACRINLEFARTHLDQL